MLWHWGGFKVGVASCRESAWAGGRSCSVDRAAHSPQAFDFLLQLGGRLTATPGPAQQRRVVRFSPYCVCDYLYVQGPGAGGGWLWGRDGPESLAGSPGCAWGLRPSFASAGEGALASAHLPPFP